MLGTKLFIEALVHEKVDTIFGYPGGKVIPLFDAIATDGRLRFILPRHEQGGAHAADGYARVSGKVGVVIATSGPGATNLITGIANAYLDSIPLVAFAGQVETELIGNDAFQEVDFTGITRSISKHNYLVKSAATLPRIIHEAFHIAATGRPGPVVVDLPLNVLLADIQAPVAPEIVLRGYKPTLAGNARQIERAANLINHAHRPVLLVGGGVITSGAAEIVREIVATTRIPVVATLMGLGAVRGDDPNFLGMLGMHGTTPANLAITHCDVLIAAGARFDDRVTSKVAGFAPHAKIIHLDIDPTSVSKSVAVDTPIVGDVTVVLRELAPKLAPPDWEEWRRQITTWRHDFPLRYDAQGMKPQFIIAELARQIGAAPTTIVTDVGQHQMWTALFYAFNEPRSLVTSGGLGTMGFGLPAAIGAILAAPEKNTVLITGDGGLQMNIQELATVRRLNLPIKILVMNNGYLGMVRQWQELFFEKRYAYTDLSDNPDFVALAQAYGIPGARCEQREKVGAALAKILAEKGPALLDLRIDREENVLPMVPGGKAINEIISPPA
jgi:acetolactate synthase-1/2/3 large subunit